MLLPPGSRLGDYEIVAPLGVGGMGEVYRARDTKLNRDVALKILPPEFGADPDRVARFKREAAAIADISTARFVLNQPRALTVPVARKRSSRSSPFRERIPPPG